MLETVASDRLLSFTVSRVSQDREFRSRLRKDLPDKLNHHIWLSRFRRDPVIYMDLLKNMELAGT